jgi:hypothetical protein
VLRDEIVYGNIYREVVIMFIFCLQSLFVGVGGWGGGGVGGVIWSSKQMKCGVFLVVGTYLRRGF